MSTSLDRIKHNTNQASKEAFKFLIMSRENPDGSPGQNINVSTGGSSNWLMYGAIGVAALYLISKAGDIPGRVELNEEDYEFLANSGPNMLQTIIDQDTSPILYTSPGVTPRTQEETAAILATLKKRYVDDAAVGSLSFPSAILSNVLYELLLLEDTEVRTQTMDVYVKMFSVYNELFTSTIMATAMGVAQITAAAGENIVNANECTEWTWAKKTDYNTDQTQTTNTTISTKSKSTKVLLGILGSGGSTSTMHNTITTYNLKEREIVEFIPHCTSTQINLAAVEAILIAQGAALKSVYEPLRAVIALAPTLPSKRSSSPKKKISVAVDEAGNVSPIV